MAVLGLGADDKKVATKSKKKSSKAKASSSQADEAKAILEQMEQKSKDKPDDCVFC